MWNVRRLTILFVLAVALCGSGAAIADAPYVTVQNANVREQADVNSMRVITFPKGTRVEVTFKEGDWYAVSRDGIHFGYIWSELLVPEDQGSNVTETHLENQNVQRVIVDGPFGLKFGERYTYNCDTYYDLFDDFNFHLFETAILSSYPEILTYRKKTAKDNSTYEVFLELKNIFSNDHSDLLKGDEVHVFSSSGHSSRHSLQGRALAPDMLEKYKNIRIGTYKTIRLMEDGCQNVLSYPKIEYSGNINFPRLFNYLNKQGSEKVFFKLSFMFGRLVKVDIVGDLAVFGEDRDVMLLLEESLSSKFGQPKVTRRSSSDGFMHWISETLKWSRGDGVLISCYKRGKYQKGYLEDWENEKYCKRITYISFGHIVSSYSESLKILNSFYKELQTRELSDDM